MREVRAFVCQHCPSHRARAFRLKTSAARHERRCVWNPEAKACRTCSHWRNDNDDQGGPEASCLEGQDYQNGERTLRRGCPHWWQEKPDPAPRHISPEQQHQELEEEREAMGIHMSREQARAIIRAAKGRR